jgi:GAF domain-containing protein
MAAEPAKSGFRAPAEESALAAGEDQAERAARRRLAAEFAVSRVLLESTSVDEAAVRLLPAIGQGLEWEMGGLWTVDPAQNVLRCNQFWTAPELTCPVDAFVAASRSVVFARGSGLPGRVWQRGEPAWITDVTEDTHFLRRAAAREDGVRGAFAFPIRGVRQTLGVIEFFRTEIQLVDEELLQMAATLGGQIGQFLERLQAEQEIQRRAREFEALYETTRDLAGSRQDLRTLLETLVERARTLLKAAAGHVWLYDAARADLEVGVAQHFPVPLGTRIRLGEGMAGRVALTREPLTVEDYRSWEHCPPRFAGMPITAVLQVPMLYGGELVGVLGVNERDGITGRRFGEADIRLLSLFAAHAAGAIVSTKAQQALGESEARLRRLVEQFPAVLWSTDTELRFTASLGAGLRALGLEPGEVVGRSLYDYFGMGPRRPPDGLAAPGAGRRGGDLRDGMGRPHLPELCRAVALRRRRDRRDDRRGLRHHGAQTSRGRTGDAVPARAPGRRVAAALAPARPAGERLRRHLRHDPLRRGLGRPAHRRRLLRRLRARRGQSRAGTGGRVREKGWPPPYRPPR